VKAVQVIWIEPSQVEVGTWGYSVKYTYDADVAGTIAGTVRLVSPVGLGPRPRKLDKCTRMDLDRLRLSHEKVLRGRKKSRDQRKARRRQRG